MSISAIGSQNLNQAAQYTSGASNGFSSANSGVNLNSLGNIFTNLMNSLSNALNGMTMASGSSGGTNTDNTTTTTGGANGGNNTSSGNQASNDPSLIQPGETLEQAVQNFVAANPGASNYAFADINGKLVQVTTDANGNYHVPENQINAPGQKTLTAQVYNPVAHTNQNETITQDGPWNSGNPQDSYGEYPPEVGALTPLTSMVGFSGWAEVAPDIYQAQDRAANINVTSDMLTQVYGNSKTGQMYGDLASAENAASGNNNSGGNSTGNSPLGSLSSLFG